MTYHSKHPRIHDPPLQLEEEDTIYGFAEPKPEKLIIIYTSSIAEKIAEVKLASESLKKDKFDELIYGNLLAINELFK